ncbi:MAG: acetate--CoA ligase family protein, partial [Alphaproteobacteria bacterium]
TEDMLDAAYACSGGIYPKGRRLGLVTISGGVGVQMADDASDLGLDVAPMPEAAQAKLKQILPFAATRNPVDVTAQAFNDISLIKRNFDIMIEEGGYDAIIAFLTMVAASPYIVDDLLAMLGALRERYPERLMVLSLIAPPDIVARYEAAGYLVFEDPCRAVAATAALAGFGESFAREPEAPPRLPSPLPRLPEGPPSERDAKALLAAAGIPVLDERLVGSAEAAEAAARDLGRPVALKLSAPGLAHKTEIGGVLLNVATPEAARDGYEMLRARAAAAGVAPEGVPVDVLVAPMVAGGVETILGVQRDPLFGPAVMFGLGGVFVEVLGDVAFRLAPFGLDEARRMIREIKGFKVLQGLRGAPPADLEALAEALVRLSVLAAAEAVRIESIDVNPFLVLPEGRGAVALDALVVPRRGNRGP